MVTAATSATATSATATSTAATPETWLNVLMLTQG